VSSNQSRLFPFVFQSRKLPALFHFKDESFSISSQHPITQENAKYGKTEWKMLEKGMDFLLAALAAENDVFDVERENSPLLFQLRREARPMNRKVIAVLLHLPQSSRGAWRHRGCSWPPSKRARCRRRPHPSQRRRRRRRGSCPGTAPSCGRPRAHHAVAAEEVGEEELTWLRVRESVSKTSASREKRTKLFSL